MVLKNSASKYSETERRCIDLFWQDLNPDYFEVLQTFKNIVERIAAGSPYLRTLMMQSPAYLIRALEESPEKLLDRICLECAALAAAESDHAIEQGLRHLKSYAALLIAIADISQKWDVVKVTAALTKFADAALNAAVNYLLLKAQSQNKFKVVEQENPSFKCGFVILAMGKHGAAELNYSSDIDLIILYDQEIAPLAPSIEPSIFFMKLTRELVALLQETTADGYVFRVDLRLRPDPRATQVAISIDAAANYYQSQGQNWERAAMIKARAVAGDLDLGTEFLKSLTPYIWRKYLDYAAIADVQSLKRQIHVVKGHGEIAVQGHNLKLGRGGIREIEFFVQTQQLIAGGKNKNLRGIRTLEMLDALAGAGWIAPETSDELKTAYKFLRELEHRVQMQDDQQSHIVPEKPETFESYARFCGFDDGASLSLKLRSTLEIVQKHYAALFKDASELSSDFGSLVFTGGEDDPATLETLQNMGFRHTSEMSAAIRGWHFGRYASTRTARARELLTELMPELLSSLANSGEADLAFLAFDNFLKGLPAGIQFFSMVKATPELLPLLTRILGLAPRLAEQLSKRPNTLEAVVSPNFFGSMPSFEQLCQEFDFVIPNSTPRDDAMDRARVLGRELQFRVGVRLLSETADAEQAGRDFSLIADVLLQKLHDVICHDMKTSHGEIEGGQIAIIAMGKLGGREMTASSDLDLIFVYDHAPEVELSNGEKPLSPTQYFARLTQRMVTAISAATSEGKLFEVDLRLRPSGSKGPVAVSLASFEKYQLNEAWTWEKLALTRARVVAGSPSLAQRINQVIGLALGASTNRDKTKSDVCDMRALLLAEKKPFGIWDIRNGLGGLVEIEFIAQYLQLIHGAPLLDTNTKNVLVLAEENNALTARQAKVLKSAILLYQGVTQFLRLCLERNYDPEQSSTSFNKALAQVVQMPDIPTAEVLLKETQSQVAAIYEEIVGRPK